MTDPKQPKEFWITGLNDYDKIIFDQDDVKTFKPDFNADGRYVHVIECSAYEGAMASLATMEEANDFKLEELKELRAKHERVLQALQIAATRSTYEWSQGPDYFPSDYANEGKIALANEILEQTKETKNG